MLLSFETGLVKTSHYDPEMRQLADRHYSRQTVGAKQFSGCGRKLVLRNHEGTVLFIWIFQNYRRDKQTGFNCSLFRNESARLSSEIILEAEQLAVEKWGAGRAFTFIDSKKIQSANPGYCFKVAGWKRVGYSERHAKIILEKFLTRK